MIRVNENVLGYPSTPGSTANNSLRFVLGTSNLKYIPLSESRPGFREAVKGNGLCSTKLDVTEAEYRGSAARDGARRQSRHQMEAYRVMRIKRRLVA